MTTFQAIVYGALNGFTEILPISSSAHRLLLAYLTGWSEPTGPLLGALTLGTALALLIYFIHDWLSMLSCFLQVVIYRKKPMTLDERMPLFLLAATVPAALAWYYGQEAISAHLDSSPPVLSAILAGFGVLLWFLDSMSRKNKNMYDWNLIDSLTVGVAQIGGVLPGCGRETGALAGAFFRNYSREAAAKFSLFAGLPILVASSVIHLKGIGTHGAPPMQDLSWLSFYVALLVAFLSSLLAIGAFMKHVQRGGMGQYAIWRVLVAAGVAAAYFIRLRHSG